MVIRDVYNRPRQRVAPSYSFDLVAVVAHARRAWALETAYQVCVLAVFVTGVATNLAATVTAVCVLLALPLMVMVLRTAPQVLRLKGKALWSRVLRGPDSDTGAAELRLQTRKLVLCTLGLCLVVLAPLLAARFLSTPMSATVPACSAMILLIVFFSLMAGAARQWAVNCLRRTEMLRPAALTARMRVIDAQQSHTLVVYSRDPLDKRDPTPFLGSGRFQRRWLPETIRLRRRAEEGAEPQDFPYPPFDLGELIDHIKIRLAELSNSANWVSMPGFAIRDRLFTDEWHATSVRELFDREPGPTDIHGAINDPYGPAHHYLEIGATQTGEVVTTIFARFLIVANALSLDIAMGALTSVPQEFLVVDAFKENGLGAVVRAAWRGLRTIPRDISRVWQLGEAPVVLTRGAWARADRTLIPRRGVVIGTNLSVRERASVVWNAPEAALIRQEITRHKALILKHLFEVIAEFLKGKGVDVSDFEKQATTVINANVFNQRDATFHGSSFGDNSPVNNETPDGNTDTEGGKI
jgi:hypothetical protein